MLGEKIQKLYSRRMVYCWISVCRIILAQRM